MKEIQLTQGKVAIVDDEDFERLNQHKWCARFDGWNWYALRECSIGNSKAKTVLMHREIMNAPKGIQVDHCSGNGLDNRKKNLRLCTHQQNHFNKNHARRDNKLGIKGVCWNKEHKIFHAQISINKKVIHLGYFTVLADADQAYRVAELKYFGEFAREETKKLYQMALAG